MAVRAQTNYFDSLTCLDGRSYTNLTIVRTNAAYLVGSHPAGLAKIYLTNLPTELQQQFGYNPRQAALQLAAEQQHEMAVTRARQISTQARSELMTHGQPVHCLEIIDIFGQCRLQTTNGVIIRAYVIGMPARIGDFYSRYWQIKTAVAQQNEYAEQKRMAAARAVADAPTVTALDRDYANYVNFQRSRANNLVVDADFVSDVAKKLNEHLKELELNSVASTTFTAYPLGWTQNELPVWQATE